MRGSLEQVLRGAPIERIEPILAVCDAVRRHADEQRLMQRFQRWRGLSSYVRTSCSGMSAARRAEEASRLSRRTSSRAMLSFLSTPDGEMERAASVKIKSPLADSSHDRRSWASCARVTSARLAAAGLTLPDFPGANHVRQHSMDDMLEFQQRARPVATPVRRDDARRGAAMMLPRSRSSRGERVRRRDQDARWRRRRVFRASRERCASGVLVWPDILGLRPAFRTDGQDGWPSPAIRCWCQSVLSHKKGADRARGRQLSGPGDATA